MKQRTGDSTRTQGGPAAEGRPPGALAASLAKAQAEMRNPARNATNPAFRSRYADLASCRDAVIPVLARHGIGIVQSPGFDGETITLTTTLLCGAESLDCGTLGLSIRGARNPAHAMGSALTYMRRYALCAVAGVAADEDDDGNELGSAPRKKDEPLDGPLELLQRGLHDRFGPPEQGAAKVEAFGRKHALPNVGSVLDTKNTRAAQGWLDAMGRDR